MKKFIYLFAIIGLIISSVPVQKAEACSFMEGTHFPTRQEVLNAGGKIYIVKPVMSGEIVPAMVQNYPVIMTVAAIPSQYVVLEGNQTSCSTGFNFSSDKYYVVVTPANDPFVIRHMEAGKQFSTGYNTMSEAQAAYDALVSGQNPNPPQPNNYTPAGYTLKYGMRGDDVKAFQQALKDYSSRISSDVPVITISTDGVYGNQTVAAVKLFQGMNGLTVDGIAGNQTQLKLSQL